jgi:alpha-N-arabinofuranosidase
MENLVAKYPGLLGRVYGLGMHYYCGTTGKGDSLEYSDDEWYQMLWQADVMDALVAQHWLAMGDYDRERKVKLLVDEWGAWHQTKPLGPAYLFNYIPSLRDALETAITLDIFHRHADKLAMCNNAQLVNNINTLFLAMEDRFVATTIFHVFDMYKSHRGGRSLRLICEAPGISYGTEKRLWGLAGSASLHGKTLVVTAVNPHVSESTVAEVSLRGGEAKSAQVTVLTAPDIHAHNDFDNPNSVVPKTEPASVSGSRFTWTFSPASVTKLEIELAEGIHR